MAERIPTFRAEGWSNAGEILRESCSIIWRLFDAQYWGVPQRRRRIFLVADFGGQRAGEILFKSESLRGHITPSTAPWKRFTAKIESGIGESSRNRTTAGGNSVTSTLTAGYSSNWNGNAGAYNGDNFVFDKSSYDVICVATQQANAEIMVNKCSTLTAANGTSGSNKPHVVLSDSEEEKPIAFETGASSRLGGHAWEYVTSTLTSQMGDNQMSVVTKEKPIVNANPASKAYGVWQNGNAEVGIMEDKTCTLTTGGGKPGHRYPCVLVEEQTENNDDTYVAAFAYQQGGSMPTLPYGEKISPPLLSSQKTAVLIDNHPADSRVEIAKDGVCQTLSARMGTGGGNVPLVMETDMDKPIAYGQSEYGDYVENRVSTLKCTGGDLGGGSESLILKQTKDEDIYVVTDASHTQVGVNQSLTLTARDYKDPHFISKPKSIVRRLTPLECERLQGFPDGWTASESDSARYKALGNSVALPCVDYIMSGVVDLLTEESIIS